MMVTVDAESLGLGPSARTTWIFEPSAPHGLHVVHDDQRVLALAGIEPELVEPTGERAWTPTPTIMGQPEQSPVLASIDLHAPLRTIYPLPRGASRFACTLEAPIETWTDCVARVTAIGYDGARTELARQRLNADTPSVEVNAELPPATERLELLIEPGAYGPIQDRVIVRQPRIIVRD